MNYLKLIIFIVLINKIQAESAKMTLEKFNKNIKINIYKEFLNPLNAGEIIK